jgi:hypothetical protein
MREANEQMSKLIAATLNTFFEACHCKKFWGPGKSLAT